MEMLNSPYNKTSSPNSVQKSLDKFYNLQKLYSGAPGFQDPQSTLQDIIDSVIVKPEPQKENKDD
jgi:hypothetical protein